MATDKRFEIHQHMISMRHRCERQLVYRYGETLAIGKHDIVEPPGVSAHIGTGAHEAVHENMKAHIKSGEYLPRDAIADAARDAFNAAYADGVMLTDEEAADPDGTRNAAQQLSILAAERHFDDVAPRIEPVATEEQFKFRINGTPFDVAGRIDLRTPESLRDVKYSGMYPIAEAAVASLQLRIYTLGSLVNKITPLEVALDYLVKGRGKEPSVNYVVRQAMIQPTWADATMLQINAFCDRLTELQKGATPQPADMGHAWACTKRYCGYWHRCPYFSGREK